MRVKPAMRRASSLADDTVKAGCVKTLPAWLQCGGSKLARAPTVQEVAKTWVGYTGDELMFVRLELHTNGTGRCAHVYLPDTCLHECGVKEYWISRWELKNWYISFHIEPATTNSWPIYLKGTSSGHIMELEVGGPDGVDHGP